jgi:hypothetical protein
MKRRRNATEWQGQLLDMARESEGFDGDVEISPELERRWKDYAYDLRQAIGDWVADNRLPPGKIQELTDDDGEYAVYMTLAGAGVGIWDGRWDHLLTEEQIEDLDRHLKQRLGAHVDETGGGRIPEEMDWIVYQAKRGNGMSTQRNKATKKKSAKKKTSKKKSAKKKTSKRSSKGAAWGKKPKKGLVDAVAMRRKHPKTFEYPESAIAQVKVGDHVKAMVKVGGKGNPGSERMWFEVLQIKGPVFRARLDNTPGWTDVHGLELGDKVELHRKYVIDTLAKKRGLFANPAGGTFTPGQIVRYTTEHLRATQNYTPPINGMVVGIMDGRVLVVWSDDDRRKVRVSPASIEVDQQAMKQADGAYLQTVLKELQKHARERNGGNMRKRNERANRYPFEIAYTDFTSIPDTGFFEDMTGTLEDDEHEGKLKDVHIGYDGKVMLIVGYLEAREEPDYLDDTAAEIFSAVVYESYNDVYKDAERHVTDEFAHEDAEWFPKEPPKGLLQALKENPRKTRPKPRLAGLRRNKRKPTVVLAARDECYALGVFQDPKEAEAYRLKQLKSGAWRGADLNEDPEGEEYGEGQWHLEAGKPDVARNPRRPRMEGLKRNKLTRNKSTVISIGPRGQICGLPGPLSSKERYALPDWAFGLPGDGARSTRKYPLYVLDQKGRPVPSKTHAINAKARAKQQLDAGNLSRGDYNKVVKMANEVIAKCKGAPSRRGQKVKRAANPSSLTEISLTEISKGLDLDPAQELLLDRLVLMARNDGAAYRAKDPAAAVERAIRDAQRDDQRLFHDDSEKVRGEAVRLVKKRWKGTQGNPNDTAVSKAGARLRKGGPGASSSGRLLGEVSQDKDYMALKRKLMGAGGGR